MGLNGLRYWFGRLVGVKTDPEHVHDFGVRPTLIPREGGVMEEVLSAGHDCRCGRCPMGYCDGTGVKEPGWV